MTSLAADNHHSATAGAAVARPRVMAVLNVTPDSFSDGGRYADLGAVIVAAESMVRDGAEIIDIGGESTRPGARPVPEGEELDRVIPVIEALGRRMDVLLSVDTSKPAVMRAAVAAGAGMINDVCALRQAGALAAASDLAVPVCLMHMKGEPRTMQDEPSYGDVVTEVTGFLQARVEACVGAGIAREMLIVDPGFGFGKQLEHNLALLRGLPQIAALGLPVLVGLSRKSLIGAVTGRPVGQRVHASVALAVYAVLNGASIVRAHDVAATVDALRMITAVTGGDLR
jgi:dihydropteroate synthase